MPNKRGTDEDREMMAIREQARQFVMQHVKSATKEEINAATAKVGRALWDLILASRAVESKLKP